MIAGYFDLHPVKLPWTVRRPLGAWPKAHGGTPNVLQVGDRVPATAFGWRDEDGEWARWTKAKQDVCVPFAALWDACKP